MILAGFNDPRYVLPGDPILLDGSLSISTSKIISYIWSITELDETPVWSGVGATATAPGITGVEADPFYRAISLTVKNIKGETHTTKRRIEVANWPSSVGKTIHLPTVSLPSKLSTTTRPLIKLQSSGLLSTESDFYPVLGTNFRMTFQPSSGSLFNLQTVRTMNGIVVDPTANIQTLTYYPGGIETSYTTNPVSHNQSTTENKTYKIAMSEENLWIDGTGWEVQEVRINNDVQDSGIVSISEGNSKTLLALNDSIYSRFSEDVQVSVALSRETKDVRTPILGDREFKKLGVLTLMYMPDTKFEKIWSTETEVARGFGYERGSKHFLPSDGHAYFRTRPIQDVFSQ